MHTRITAPRFLLGFILILSAGTIGCETETPGTPDIAAFKTEGADPGWAFFPLQQGNRWEHARELRVQITPDGGEPQEPVVVEARIESAIHGTEVRDGLTYEILEQHWYEEGDTFLRWLRMRQDKGGLYEADVLLTEPPLPGLVVRSGMTPSGRWNAVHRGIAAQVAAEDLDPVFLRTLDEVQGRLARIMELLHAERGTVGKASHRGGPEANEFLRLVYPLHAHSTWTVKDEPLGTATVEGREVLQLPAGKMPAWRLRLEWEFLQPGDRVFLWYGRCGMLKLQAHTEGVATDESGQPIGTLVAEESEVLVDWDVQRGGCH